jgi:hypothetical protein
MDVEKEDNNKKEERREKNEMGERENTQTNK